MSIIFHEVQDLLKSYIDYPACFIQVEVHNYFQELLKHKVRIEKKELNSLTDLENFDRHEFINYFSDGLCYHSDIAEWENLFNLYSSSVEDYDTKNKTLADLISAILIDEFIYFFDMYENELLENIKIQFEETYLPEIIDNIKQIIQYLDDSIEEKGKDFIKNNDKELRVLFSQNLYSGIINIKDTFLELYNFYKN